jgi:hypothetical protein
MRYLFVLAIVVAACGNDSGRRNDDLGLDAPEYGFQVVTPEIEVLPGEEITTCYYFRVPTTEDMVIKRWHSVMTEGSHHLIFMTTELDVKPPGHVSAKDCGFATSNPANLPPWMYTAQTPEEELTLPSDDGTGLPIGQEIRAGTPGYFQMHYVNPSDAPLKVRVALNAEAYPPGTAYTKTATFITYNADISIPPNAVNDVERQTCDTPGDVNFWLLSTHAHKQAVKTVIKNGMPDSTNIAFESTDWAHPGIKQWMGSPFYTFPSGKMTFECTYVNLGDNAGRTITAGDSAVTDEMCMAGGYYFPAVSRMLCYCDSRIGDGCQTVEF